MADNSIKKYFPISQIDRFIQLLYFIIDNKQAEKPPLPQMRPSIITTSASNPAVEDGTNEVNIRQVHCEQMEIIQMPNSDDDVSTDENYEAEYNDAEKDEDFQNPRCALCHPVHGSRRSSEAATPDDVNNSSMRTPANPQMETGRVQQMDCAQDERAPEAPLFQALANIQRTQPQVWRLIYVLMQSHKSKELQNSQEEIANDECSVVSQSDDESAIIDDVGSSSPMPPQPLQCENRPIQQMLMRQLDESCYGHREESNPGCSTTGQVPQPNRYESRQIGGQQEGPPRGGAYQNQDGGRSVRRAPELSVCPRSEEPQRMQHHQPGTSGIPLQNPAATGGEELVDINLVKPAIMQLLNKIGQSVVRMKTNPPQGTTGGQNLNLYRTQHVIGIVDNRCFENAPANIGNDECQFDDDELSFSEQSRPPQPMAHQNSLSPFQNSFRPPPNQNSFELSSQLPPTTQPSYRGDLAPRQDMPLQPPGNPNTGMVENVHGYATHPPNNMKPLEPIPPKITKKKKMDPNSRSQQIGGQREGAGLPRRGAYQNQDGESSAMNLRSTAEGRPRPEDPQRMQEPGPSRMIPGQDCGEMGDNYLFSMNFHSPEFQQFLSNLERNHFRQNRAPSQPAPAAIPPRGELQNVPILTPRPPHQNRPRPSQNTSRPPANQDSTGPSSQPPPSSNRDLASPPINPTPVRKKNARPTPAQPPINFETLDQMLSKIIQQQESQMRSDPSQQMELLQAGSSDIPSQNPEETRDMELSEIQQFLELLSNSPCVQHPAPSFNAPANIAPAPDPNDTQPNDDDCWESSSRPHPQHSFRPSSQPPPATQPIYLPPQQNVPGNAGRAGNVCRNFTQPPNNMQLRHRTSQNNGGQDQADQLSKRKLPSPNASDNSPQDEVQIESFLRPPQQPLEPMQSLPRPFHPYAGRAWNFRGSATRPPFNQMRPQYRFPQKTFLFYRHPKIRIQLNRHRQFQAGSSRFRSTPQRDEDSSNSTNPPEKYVEPKLDKEANARFIKDNLQKMEKDYNVRVEHSPTPSSDDENDEDKYRNSLLLPQDQQKRSRF